MIKELLSAILLAALPVGAAAYLMVWWALRNGHLGMARSLADIENEFGRMSKDKQVKEQGDLVQRKWLGFGGGFYGLVSLLTLAHIEAGEVVSFFGDFEGLGTLTGLISLETVVALLVETLKNTVTALIWPIYWLGAQPVDHAWLWLAVAYAGYWIGLKVAAHRLVTPVSNPADSNRP